MSHFSHYWGEYPHTYIGVGLAAEPRSWHVLFDAGVDFADESVIFFVALQVLCFSANVHGEVFWKG